MMYIKRGTVSMIITKSILFFICMFLESTLTGFLIERHIPGKKGIGFKIISGFITTLALYQIVFDIIKLFIPRLSIITVIWQIIMCIISFISVIRIAGDVLHNKREIKPENILNWKVILPIISIAIQIIIMLIYYIPDSAPEQYFLGAAVQQYESDSITVNDPYTGTAEYVMPYNLSRSHYVSMISGLCRICGIHPAQFVHLQWMTAIVLLSYAAWYVFGSLIYDRPEDINVFVAIAGMLMMFGVYSANAFATAVYSSVWQGKTVYTVLILPMLVYYMSAAMDRGKKMAVQGGLYNWLYVFIANIASVMLTPMSIFVSAAVSICIMIYYLLHNKKLSSLIFFLLAQLPFAIYYIKG